MILAAATMAFSLSAAPKSYTLASPDGKLSVKVDVNGAILYSVSCDSQELISPSEISMTLENGTVYSGAAKLQKASTKTVDETITPVVYKKNSVRDNYNELTLSYKEFNVIFRAYNDGAAYRFVSKSKVPFNVKSEKASFSFPADWNTTLSYVKNQKNNLEEQFFYSFENLYTTFKISNWDSKRLAFLPVMVEAPSGYKLCITEADLFNYPGMYLYNGDASTTLSGVYAPYPKDVKQGGHNMLQGLVQTREDYIAKCEAGEVFPWRLIQVAREDKELANSDLVYKLAKAEDKSVDWSWIKPGKVAWDWWNDWNIYGVDFESGINNDTYKYYIDFAASKGIEYVILDEGWAVNLKADLMQVIDDIDLVELSKYAQSKNVGLVLWGGYWAFNRDMEGVCKYFSSIGIKGFKIDFMDRDDQAMVNFYVNAAKTAAKYNLFVDFHGAYKPTGLQRTYPNVVNFEGVHGLEQMKWEEGCLQVPYDVTIPFIRMMAGPFDYTQGAMRNATKSNYVPVYDEAMSQGTRCRQLAEYVVFEAPFNMLCDSPSNYLKEPECTEFIATVPTVWDETTVIDGKVGQYIATARRSGDAWYVGAMTDWSARDLSLDLSFLGEGEYEMVVFKDGKNAHRAACDYKKETVKVPADKKVCVHMAPGGGWAAKIVKK